METTGYKFNRTDDSSARLCENSIFQKCTSMWNEEEREVLVLQAEGGPLIGMSLLYGYRVILHVVDNEDVIIDTLP